MKQRPDHFIMMTTYHFDDQCDLIALNRKLSAVGITIQQDLFGSYVAYENAVIRNTESKPITKGKQTTATSVQQHHNRRYK